MADNTLQRLENKYIKAKKIKNLVLVIAIVMSIICFFVVGNLKSDLVTGFCVSIILFIWFTYLILFVYFSATSNKLINLTESNILRYLNLKNWYFIKRYDDLVIVKSSQAVSNFTDVKYFKENAGKLEAAIKLLAEKQQYSILLINFLKNNDFKNFSMYSIIEQRIKNNLQNTKGYNIFISYTSPAGRSHSDRFISISPARMNELESDKSLLMSKSEYSKYLKDIEHDKLEQKKHAYYDKINEIIDFTNEKKNALIIKGDLDELDKQITTLFDRTINSISKIKTLDSGEWLVLDKLITSTDSEIHLIVDRNQRILDYYESSEFKIIKNTCDNLMASQKDFNEYIEEKVIAISSLFGTKVVRNETNNEDEFAYIHPYKKSITPFTAEVSANVFASAENKPLEYVVKYFYPTQVRYPEQIQKLQSLIEELETLKEARIIIENYKREIQQYLTEVPAFVLENDEDGFYSKLGFAIINENTLNVEYKFSYTSNGGKAQRSFTIPMTEETIVELIKMLESKLTLSAFSKEQRSLMTSKLRQQIKQRDNYTCKICGNSTHNEPNLLLEIDHIIPVVKGGTTHEDNLQTLCWKCNRQKSSKLM